MKKSDVNGENALPLYKYLKSQKGFEGFTGPKAEFMDKHLAKIDPDFKNNPAIKWNFTKFLIDREGKVVARFEPIVTRSIIHKNPTTRFTAGPAKTVDILRQTFLLRKEFGSSDSESSPSILT